MDEPKKRIVVLPGWRFELAVTLAAFGVLGAIVYRGTPQPAWGAVAVLAGLLLLAENTSIVLPSAANVSPGFMIVMAAIAGFGRGGGVLGAALVELVGAVGIGLLRQRRYTTVLFNCADSMLAAAAAASVYIALGGGVRPQAFFLSVATFAVVNVGLVLVQIVLNYEERPAAVWADIRPVLPNYLVFGLLGLVVGSIYRSLGPLTLPLLVVPGAIARKAFTTFIELRDAQEATVRVFIRAIEAKDPYTAGHAERVAKYAQYMGEEMGFTPARQEHLRYAALMHDIGKLAVPGHLLNKPGRLTPEEYAVVQRHNHVCVDILTKVDFMASMVDVASDKHAHYDGDHSRTDDRAMEAYIITVADAFDAMTSTRSYRKALSMGVAFAELTEKSGSQFHPECAAALIKAIERRDEHYGLGFEVDAHEFAVAPPEAGVGSAGLGDFESTESMPA
jgi:putative nucleotidyltransferase with HDIG domain